MSDDFGSALGKLVGGILGAAGSIAKAGGQALLEKGEADSAYFKCPYCGASVKTLKYRCSMLGSSDKGRRQCSSCSMYFYID